VRAARDVKATLAAGVTLLVLVAALTLTQAPPRVVSVGALAKTQGPAFIGGMSACQRGEVIPAGISAVRVAIGGFFGPPVQIKAFVGNELVLQARRGANWTGTSVTIPVTSPRRSYSHVKLCINVAPTSELAVFRGSHSPRRLAAVQSNGESLGGKIGVEYLGAGRGSWWSRLGTVAESFALGHFAEGVGAAVIVAIFMLAAGALALRITLRELS
jgi:hypothetical protein